MNKNFKYNNCIQPISNSSNIKENNSITLYDISGSKNTNLSKDGDIFAKRSVKDGNIKFFAKANNNLQLLNPFNESFTVYNINNTPGSDVYNFVEITQKSFDHYISFLQSQNSVQYRLAQKELSETSFVKREYISSTDDSVNFPEFKMYNSMDKETNENKNSNKRKNNRNKRK
jgi:hypothetical protein